MAMTPDLSRLRQALADPRLERLLALLRRRLEMGIPLSGFATLTAATGAERAAVDALIGRRPTRGATLTVDLDALSEMLRVAGICEDLPCAVEALHGPIVNRRAANLKRAAEWDTVWSDARTTFAHQPALLPWIDELAQTGTAKRICGEDPAGTAIVLQELERIVASVPAQAVPLPAFAARLFGDAHALDPGSPRATLAVRAVARLGGVRFEDDAEGRRAAWAGVGVMCDELSTPALVFNLAVHGDTALARLLRTAAGAGEPLHVSLRMLLRSPLGNGSGIRDTDVFVCENPTLLAMAVSQLGRRCAPLVCVNGQFATPALVLLRQLRAAGARLHYHGDFDPAGIGIARRVLAESGARPWRFGSTDYRAAPKGVRFTGSPGATPWDEALSEAMCNEGRSVHEEAVFDSLAMDLTRKCVVVSADGAG